MTSASEAIPTRRDGLGLRNIEERLRASYGNRQRLTLRHPDARSWEVTLDLPYRQGAGHPSP